MNNSNPYSRMKSHPDKYGRLASTGRRLAAFLLITAFLLPVSVPVRAATFDAASASGGWTVLSSVIYAGTYLLKTLWGKPANKRSPQNSDMPGPAEVTQRQAPLPPPSNEERKAKVASLELNPSGNLTLQVEQPQMMGAIPLDKDGNLIQGLVADWESSDPEIVSITEDGQAVAHKVGTAHLTATAGNKRETVKVTVVEGEGKFGGKKRDSKRENGRGNSQSRRPAQADQIARNQTDESLRLAHPMKSVPALTPMLPVDQDPLPDDETASLYQPSNAVGNPPRIKGPSANLSAAIQSTEMSGSGNFSFGVPLLRLPGRGLDVSLGLAYNSRVWHKSTDSENSIYMTYDVDNGWPAPGFKLGYGQMEDQGSAGFTLTDPDGTRHQLKRYVNYTDPNRYETTDSSFIIFDGGRGWGTVTYPDGTRVALGAADTGPRSYPTQITDSNGNYIRIYYVDPDGAGPKAGVGPKIDYIQDTMGRLVKFYYAGDDLIAITAPGYNNNTVDRTVARFYYDYVTISSYGANAFASQVYPNFSGQSRVLRYVYFPNTRTGYRYDYASPYGVMTRITRLLQMTVSSTALDQAGTVTSDGQTAATTDYNYPTTGLNLTDAPGFTTRTDDWMGRTTTSPAVYEYSGGPDSLIDYMTAPDGTVTETRKVVAHGQWYDGFITDIIVKKNNVGLFSQHIDGEAYGDGINPRITQVQITNDAGQTKTIQYEYTAYSLGSQNYNNALKVREFDLTTDGSLGAELRRTETDYVTSSWYTSRGLKHLPTAQRVIVNNAVVSRTAYAYDQSTPTPRSGIIMYADPGTNFRGNVTSVTGYADADAGTGATTNTMAYDVAGNVISETVNCCNLKTFSYTSAYKFAYPESVARGDAGQFTESATYDFNTGLLRTFKDENLQVTTEDYQIEAYPNWHMITRPDGGYSKEIYFEESRPDPDAAHSHTSAYSETYLGGNANAETGCYRAWQYMDGRGQVARTFSKTGLHGTAEAYAVTDIDYDSVGRVSSMSNPYYVSNGDSSPRLTGNYWTTVSDYDGLGRARVVTLQDGGTIQTAYSGTQTTVTDQAGRSRRQTVDALGRVRTVVEPDSNGSLDTANALTTTYEYDGLSNLTQITQGEQTRKFKYDSLGHLTHQKQVESVATLDDDGVLVGASGQWTYVAKYDAKGLLTDAYDARGVHTKLDYLDGLNRLTGVTYLKSDGLPEGTPSVTYTYDEDHSAQGYFNKGRLTTVTTASAGSTPQTIQGFDYDRMGRIVKQKQTVGADPYTITYAYGLVGELKSETYPSLKQIKYTYDLALRLASVTNGSDQPYSNTYKYAAHGGLTSESLGNGAVQSFDYNNLIELKQIKLAQSSNVLQQYDYKYGVFNPTTGALDESKNTGQIAQIEGTIGTARQWRQQFRYDSLGRLKQASEYRGDNLSSLTYKNTYSYDRYGNRYQKLADNPLNGSDGQTNPQSYIAVEANDVDTLTNRFKTSVTNIQYDSAGNVTIDPKFTGKRFEYDANGRMTKVKSGDGAVTQGEAVYDGLGQRVQVTESGVTRKQVYDIFGQLVAEYGGGLEEGDPGGVKYLMADHEGSTRVVMNSTGNVINRRDYRAFGEEIGAGVGMRTGAGGQQYGAGEGTRKQYAGMERDKSGLDHTTWRKYDNSAGRWTTPDPLSGRISDPQSFNRYSYVENDPVNLVDPTGLTPASNCNGVIVTDPATGLPQCIPPIVGGTVTVNGNDTPPMDLPIPGGFQGYTPRPPPTMGGGTGPQNSDPAFGLGDPPPAPKPIYCNQDVIDAMKEAFNIANTRSRDKIEAGFTIEKDASAPGGYSIVKAQYSNDYSSLTMTITGNTLSLFHVHQRSAYPNGNDEPIARGDKGARRGKNPPTQPFSVYAISKFGLTRYDPIKGKSEMLRNGLDWQKPC